MERDFRGIFYFNAAALTVLIIIGAYNYLLFHMVIELSTVFLGVFIYLISVYSKKYSRDNNFVFIGIAYLFIGTFDMLHTLAFEGIGIFDFSISVAARFWIGARFMEAFVLFFAFHKLLKVKNVNVKKTFISFFIVSLVMLIAIYSSSYFPKLYIEESGYTTYKRSIDFIIIIIYLFAIYAVNKNETRVLNRKVIIIAIALKIISEFLYLVSSGNGEVIGMFSHVFKYLSYVALFTVFVRESLMRPYENIFRAFKDKEDELIELSKKDSLTGLYNHSTSYEIIREIIKENTKNKKDICLMMIDVDDFKCINDKYGHVKGDEILVNIAKIFTNCEGPLELAGRYGGDEFVVLFTDCDGERAKKVAKKIFVKMGKLSEDVEITVTISIGIAEWKKGFTAKDLVNSADYQMYEAKSIGKNTFNLKAKGE